MDDMWKQACEQMDGFVSRCLDEQLFDTLKIHEGFETSEVNDYMKQALIKEIERRGLKNGGVL